MAINYIKSSKKISSRDATMYFGYSADHVAYLIRNGKINGKKIYTKEAWKVSKKDLLEYLEERNKKFSQKGFFGILNGIRYFFKKYLSLKEASAISGYAPDYIGYLVRQEKIRGKKVYFGASWVTTKDAVKKYLDGKPPRKYQKPVTLSFPFWKKEKYFSFKIAKSGIFAALLIVFLSGWVLANSNQNQNQFVNIYPSQIQNIPKDNQAWKNEKKAIGPANVEPKGTLEYFSELNSAVYGGGAGSLFLSSFNETEFDLEMQDFGEKIKKESEEKKEESPGDIQQPAAETVETEESVEEEKSAETGENSALEAGAGEENEFSEVEKQSGDFSEENPKQDNTQKEALESEDYSEAEEESEPEDLLLAEDGEKEQKQAEEDATREEEVQGEDLQPQNQSGVLSETQNQSQEQSFVPLPDAGEEQVSFLEKIKNLFGKSTAKAGELLNFKEASQKNLISAKIKISLASGVKSSDIIPIESQISAGSKQGGFWEKIKGAFGFFKKQAPQIAKAQKDAGSFEEDQPEPIALPATEGETGGQEEGMKEEEYAGEEEDGQEQPVEYTGELSQEDPKQEEEAEQLEQPESQGQEKESGEEKNLTADAGLGQEEIQLESEAEQEKKEKDEQAKDLEKEENQEKEENPQPKAQPQTDQELFEQSKEETILPNPDDKVIIWYSLDGEEWIKLYSLSQDYFSNNSNGGYLSLEAPFLNSWEDIENLQIKIEGAAGGDLASPVYLDSFWVEAEYNEEPLSEDFELVALKKDWAASEEPVFELRDLKEQKIGFAQKLFASAVSTFNGQEAETETQIKAALIGPSEKKRNLKEGKEFEKDKNSGGETIKISRPESFKPGLHTFKLSVEKYGKTYSLEQDFTWGVLVVNSNKSIYSPGEKAYLQMGVLDEEGNTVCDAELELEIIAPDGSKTILKTDGPGKFIAASQNPLEKIESEDFEEKDEQAEESFKEDSDKFNSAGQSVGLEESYVEPEEKEEQQEDSSSEEEIDFFQPEKADLDSSQEKDKDIEDAGILTEESQSQAAADDNIDSENLLPVQEGEADAIEEFADIEAQESLEGVQPPEENLQISEDVDSGYEVEADEGDSMKKEVLEESQNISDAEPEDLLSKIKKNISQNLLMGTAYAAPMDPPAFDEQGNEVYLPGLSGNLKKSLDSGEYLPASGGGDIYYSGKCGANNVVDVPDYFAYYDVGQKGEYKIKLTARTANGEYAIADSFEARDWVPFDIERIGPTRIFPPADYQMKLTIKANEDFKGEIVETVPANFQILNNKIQNIKFEESENVSNSNFRVLNISNKEKKLIWSNVVLKQGDTIEIDYAFNAPDISPYIYFLGPMGMEKLANTGVLVSDADGLAKPAERKSQIIFQEIRQWQIASDATGYDVKVQRNITDFGASEDSLAVNIDSVSATSSAFARLTDVVMKSGGLSAGSTATKNNDDVGASILLTATNQITVYRESTGENADYRTAWEVWEYTGSPGGANEFIVRYQDHITMASGQQDQTVSGISNINNCVPFVTGIRNTGVSVDFDDMTVTAEMYESEGTNYVRLKREGTGGTTYVSVAVVEFTGSNWTVQNNISHKFSAAAANETETINNVSDWTKAFIISSYRTGNGEEGLEEQGWNTWPKDSDEIYFRLRTGADNVSTKNYYVIANVIQNSELTVQHIDSITGSGTEHEAGSASPQTINETINTVASTTATGLFSTHDCTGSATAFPRPMWNYYLSAADNVQYWRSFYGQPGDWALQVIQFPEATSSGTSSITVSGTVFTDEGSTTSTVGSVINLAIDGVWTASTTASTTDGSYTLDTGTATMAAGTVLTMYTSNAAELGNTVTRYLGSDNVTGTDIYQNRIIVRHEDDGPITNTDLGKYDNDDDSYLLYTANNGFLAVEAGTKLIINAGDTYTPEEAVNIAVDSNGDLLVQSEAVLNGSSDITINGGDATGAGTINITSGTDLANMMKIDGGRYFHACGVSDDGNAYCWGLDDNGQLGNGVATSTLYTTPIRVLKGAAAAGDTDGTYLTNIKNIRTGMYHTCAVSNAGNIYCWGYNNKGQLGNSSSSTSTLPIRVLKGAATTTDNDGTYLTNIKEIDAGSNHSCAVSNAGHAYCWGYNSDYELGDGLTGDQSTPIRVHDGAATTTDTDGTYLTNIKRIACSSAHNCAVSNAGNAYCWGTNGSGQLGDDSVDSRSTPVRVHDGAATTTDTDGTYLRNISNIETGHNFTCAVSNTGNPYCWGNNDSGMLGNGTTTTPYLTPVRVLKGSAADSDNDGTYLTNIQNVDGGYGSHTCALSNSGNAYCWGYYATGRLGSGSLSTQTSPVRVLEGNSYPRDTDGTYLTNGKTISTSYVGGCVISGAGNTYCWGDNSNGQLGNGATTTATAPVRTSKGEAAGGSNNLTNLINIKSIVGGFYHTCAVSNVGNPYCWGHNGNGQLGNSFTANKTSPVRVLKGEADATDNDGIYLTNIKSINPGSSYSCAVSNTGNPYCWGLNSDGKLGNGTTTQSLTPVRVLKGEAATTDNDGTYLTNIQTINSGFYHTCAVSNSGNAYCWGFNDYDGELGNGTTDPSSVPTRVIKGEAATTDNDGTNLTNIKSIGIGEYHTCAVSNAGNVYCWGYGGDGELGNSSSTSQTSPVRVLKGEAATTDNDGTYLTNIATVSSGRYHSCVFSNAGNSYCWGLNDDGELGDGTTDPSSVPTRVIKGEAATTDNDGTNLTNIKEIDAGAWHSCAISGAGNTYCWGYNSDGQLGNASTSLQLSPVRVLKGEADSTDNDGTNLTNIKNVNIGGFHSCAISSADKIYCWGDSLYGQIGNSSTTDKNTPVRTLKGEEQEYDGDFRNPTFTLDGTGSFGGSTAWSFYNLVFGDGNGGATTTNIASGVTTTIANYLAIGAGQELLAGSNTWEIQGDSITNSPFLINGTFTAQTSTFAFTADHSIDIPASHYYNLHLIDPPRERSGRTVVVENLDLLKAQISQAKGFLQMWAEKAFSWIQNIVSKIASFFQTDKLLAFISHLFNNDDAEKLAKLRFVETSNGKIEIGGSDPKKVLPQIELGLDGGQAEFSLKLIDSGTEKESVKTEGDKIIWKKGNKEIHFYELKNGTSNNIGKAISPAYSYEQEIVLKKKPKSNIFQFDMQTGGLQYNYREDGSVRFYKDVILNEWMPEEFREKSQRTIFTIDPIVIWDAKGKRTSGKIAINDNILNIEVPQEFLDKASYPVSIDPSYTISSSAENTSTAWGTQRKIVRDSNGNLHATYYKIISYAESIFYAKSSDNGETWTETQLTSGESLQVLPSIAIDSNDHIHIVWIGTHSGSPLNLQVRYIKYTTSWQSIENLTSDDSYEQVSAPSIAIDSNDYVHIVWSGKHSGSTYYQIRYIKYTDSWQSVENLTSESYHQYAPSLAVDSNDYLHVAWYGTCASSTVYTQIRYIKYTTSWQSIETLTSGDYHQEVPSLAVDSKNYVHIAWLGNISGSSYDQIRYIKYTDSWQSVENLTSDDSYDQQFPSIAIDGNNYLYVAWSGAYSDSPTYKQIRYIKNTGSWGSISNLTSASADQLHPVLIWENYPLTNGVELNQPVGGYAFVWVDDTTVKYYASEDLEWSPNVVYTLGTTTGQTFTIDNNFVIGNASDTMAVTAATWNPTIDIGGNVSITASSTLMAPPSSSFTTAGNWANTGSFVHSSGTTTFDGSGTSTFSGATTFYNLFSNTASKVLEFTSGTGATTTVVGTLTLDGQACDTQIKLRSTNTDSYWYLDVLGSASVTYSDVQDSNATGSTETITATNSTDSGNNTKWSLTGDSCEMYPKINTLIDNFNDNSFDEEKWIRTNSTQVLEQNQELELSTILSGNYVAIASTGYYDLTDSFALVEWIASGNNSLSSYEAYPLQLFVDSANGLSILNSAGTVYYSKRVGNVNTNLAIEEYSSISHRWLKILESGGTVYFSRSADGIIWNNVASTSTASLSFGIDSMYAEISAGTWQEESATTTMIIDNFNATPSEKVSDNFDDNSINGSIWTIQEGTGTVIENGQKIILTPAPNTDGSSPILYTSGNYDLTNSSVYVNVKQVCNSNIKTTFDFILGNDYDNRFYIDHYNGDLEFYKVISGSSSLVASIAYNDSAMSWWRVRGSGGIIYGEYSANGSDWYELGNFSDSFGADYMRIILETYEIGSVDSPGEAWFDNFNTIGATVSGTVFTDEGSTTSTVGSVINLAIDGVWTASTTVSTMDGSYAFVGVSQPATSTVLTVYTSNAAELGNTVTRYLGSGDVAGLDIYQNHIIVRHEDDGPITITDLDQYDTDDDATYMLYTANAGAGTLTVNSTSTEFFVWTGDTFSVGDVSGAISLAGVDINGTFIATSTQTISVSGDWDATGGTFTSASSTVQFTATTTGKTITVNENPFYNLTFNGSGGEWTLQDAATTTNDLTITAGTALSSYDMAVQGGDVTGDGVLYWTGTSSFLVRGTGNFGGSTLWRFYDLIFGDGNEATTTNPGSDYILIGNSLTIASNHTLNAGSATWDLAGQGTPFIVNGTFNSQTSVLYYSSPWDTNITATNYYDLKLQPYLVFSDNFETGNLSLWDGTFTSSGSILEATSAQVYSGNYSTGFKVGGADGNAHMEKDYLGEAQTSIVDFYLYIPSDFSWGTASAINIMGFSDNSWNDRFSMMIEDWGNIRLTYVYWDSIGSRHWTDGGTYLSKDHWYHIKGEDYVDSSNGYIKIWIDDALFVNNTGINTGSTSIDNIYGGSTWADGSHSLLYEDNIVFYNVPTYTLGTTGGQNITVNHDFILGNGTDGVHLDSAAQNPSIDVNGSVLISTSSVMIAPTSSSFTVAGDWSNFGTFTNSTGTVTFDASLTGKTIEAGNSSFYNVVFDNASGGWTVASDATSTNNWSITNAAAFELSASKTIEVGGQYSIGDSAPSATTWNSGSVLYLNSETAYTVGSKTQSQEAYAILQVGADTDIRTWNSSAATSTVDASGSLYSMNHGNVSGSAYIWGDFHTNANDYLSYANDFDGTPGANRQCQLTLASGAAITIDNGDNLEIKGGGTSSDDITTVSYAPASGSWNFNNNSGSETIIQEASLGYIDFVNGTTTVINTILNNETVTSTGVLNVDWYLGAHLVDKDNESGNVDTDGEGITISEASSTAVIYQHSGSAWIGPVSSTTTDSGADGKNPQPNSSLAIRIREYQKTAAETTYYKYNLAVSSGAGFSAYNYFNDYGSSYITSAFSSESSGVDKCISESWQRDAIGAMNTPYSSVNEMPENGSWYVGMASDLQFSIDSASVSLGTLSAGNNWTGTGATILSATTSYPGGYSITAYASNDGRLRLGATGNYINRWDYANSTPALWSTNCEDNDSYCGFGYTTDDITLGGTGDEDRFGSGTKYAGFATTSPGDIVADSTTTAFGATTTVSYKVSAKSEYADGEYNTTVYYLCTVNY
ncbi:MAG: hypothetical protein WC322_00850 [Candidatus Paceibacterota bacterium]